MFNPQLYLLDLLVRYSDQEDALRHVVKVLRSIERGDRQDELGVVTPGGSRPRGLAELDNGDVRQRVDSFRAGTIERTLAERYGISESSVKQLLSRYR